MQVQKISKHITKKVADKLTALFKNDREKYENCWEDTANFIKFGCIKENDFYEKVKDIIIYKDINGKFSNVKEFIGETEEENKNGELKTIYYVTDEEQQSQYVKMFKDAGLNAITCDSFIDPHFVSFLEYKVPDKLKFMRIDADVNGALKSEESAEDSVLIDIFKNAINDDKIVIKTEKLKNSTVPAIITVDEIMRRYSEMGKFYGMSDGDVAKTFIVNTANPVVETIKELSEDKQKFVAKYIYSLALLSFKKLTPEELENFVSANLTLLTNYIK